MNKIELDEIADRLEEQLDSINHPKHYQGKTLEVIQIIEDFDLGYNLGNAIKYILRASKKVNVNKLDDLRKAIWYLNRERDKNDK